MRQDERRNQNDLHKNTVRLILHMVCIIGLICCVGWLAWYLITVHRENARMEQVREDLTSALEPTMMAAPTGQPQPEFTPESDLESDLELNLFGEREYPDLTDMDVPEKEIDFAGLKEINPDVYAWLYVPDTNIDYPVLQREGDADYYLDRDIEGKSSAAGAIFTQYYNSKDWTDNHTVIYGHNMLDRSMFATLHNYEDSLFFEEHPYFYIFTPDHTLVYQVFGAYKFSDIHLILGFNTGDHDSFQQYLDGVFALDGMGVNFDRSLDVTADDRIVTLSTCVGGGQSAYRYVVQARLAAVGRTAGPGEAEDDGESAGTAEASANR